MPYTLPLPRESKESLPLLFSKKRPDNSGLPREGKKSHEKKISYFQQDIKFTRCHSFISAIKVGCQTSDNLAAR